MRSGGSRTGWTLIALALLCTAGLSPVAAQDADDIDEDAPISRPVIQALPPKGTDELNAALLRLSRNPGDVNALVDAGQAALKLNDIDAAIGFFSRADRLARGNARAKAGLGAAFVRSENPYDALLMFDEAERAGAPMQSLAADRGLAHDLVGDNARAQELYRIALARGPDPEIARRLALSLAVSGDRAASEATLRPLLDRRDVAAYRTRAFALAILGDVQGAQDIASVRLPRDLSTRIGPYLRYMPRLTPAQQVAAATFGHFPKTADVGRDDPRATRLAGATPRTPARRADSALIPSGEPLGKPGRAKVARADTQPSASRARKKDKAAANPAPRPTPAPTAPPAVSPAAAAARPGFSLAQTPSAPAPQASPTPQPAAPISQPAATAPQPSVGPPAPQVPAAAAAPAPSLPPFASVQPPAAAPAATAIGPPAPSPAAVAPVAPQPAAEAKAPQSVADAFADLTLPPPEPARPASGAVDISQFAPPREPARAPGKAEAEKALAEKKAAADKAKVEKAKPAKPEPPKQPSRIWVQVATGRDREALAFDWRRFTRSEAKLFKGRSAYVAKWGRTNRLVTGPFTNEKQADAFVADLKKAGIDAFTFTSKDGEAVDPI